MKIIIADDHVLFRETLEEYIKRNLPSADLTVVGDCFAVKQALASQGAVDLVILDYNMGGMNNGAGVTDIKKVSPSARIAIMSGVAGQEQIRHALSLGAEGYFPKTLSGNDFIAGIEAMLSGEIFIPVCPESGEILKAYDPDGAQTPASSKYFITQVDVKISPREAQILSALLKGLANKEIANDFNLQEVTIKMHVSNICQKLGVKNRTQAALKARELGFKES